VTYSRKRKGKSLRAIFGRASAPESNTAVAVTGRGSLPVMSGVLVQNVFPILPNNTGECPTPNAVAKLLPFARRWIANK
jgi:hypothetical protein